MINGRYGGGGESRYDVAQICVNGHVVNHSSQRYPQHSTHFCASCGHTTITSCQHCSVEIRGKYHVPNVVGGSYPRPAYCTGCGAPYPWTDSAIRAAKALADDADALTADERMHLKESLDELVMDTPQTSVAATRFKRLAAKAGKDIADGFRSILIDVISESAKKLIWP